MVCGRILGRSGNKEVVLQSHLFEALLGSLPLLMVTVGLGGAGGPPAVTGGGPLPGTRPFGLPGAPKLESRGTGAALLLENTGPVPFPVGQTNETKGGRLNHIRDIHKTPY